MGEIRREKGTSEQQVTVAPNPCQRWSGFARNGFESRNIKQGRKALPNGFRDILGGYRKTLGAFLHKGSGSRGSATRPSLSDDLAVLCPAGDAPYTRLLPDTPSGHFPRALSSGALGERVAIG